MRKVVGLRPAGDVLGCSDGLSAKCPACAEQFDSKDSSLSIEVDRDCCVVHGDVSNATVGDLSWGDLVDQVDVGGVRIGIVSHSHTRHRDTGLPSATRSDWGSALRRDRADRAASTTAWTSERSVET